MQGAERKRHTRSECMSDSLNDVWMFSSQNQSEIKVMAESKALQEREISFIEWQLLRDSANASMGPPSSNAELRSPSNSIQKHNVVTSAGLWDTVTNSTKGRSAVNNLEPLLMAPGRSDPDGSVLSGQVPSGMGDSLEVQFLSHVMVDGRDEMQREEFGEKSTGLSSLTLGHRGNSSAQLIESGLVGQSYVAKFREHVPQRAPYFRNLFPLQSSGFTNVLSHGREDLTNDVSEQIRSQKRARKCDFVHSPDRLSRSGLDQIQVSDASQDECQNHSFCSNRGVSSAHLIDNRQRYYRTHNTSFPSLLSEGPGFSSTMPMHNLSLLSLHPSNFSGRFKPALNDMSSLKGSLVYNQVSSADSKVQNVTRSGARSGLLLTGSEGFEPSHFTRVITGDRSYLQACPLGQVQPIQTSSVDTGIAAAWSTNFINFSSPSLESPGQMIPGFRSRWTSLDPDLCRRDQFCAVEREVHPVPEYQMRLLIQKQLTTTDVGSLGRIILPKKEAETNFPNLLDKEGIEMCFYDFDVDRNWLMKYRFWPNNKSRMYLLENTGDFAKYHGLQQGDLLLVYRQLPARYILRVRKMAPPLRLVTSPQNTSDSVLNDCRSSLAIEIRGLTSPESSTAAKSSPVATKKEGQRISSEHDSTELDGGIVYILEEFSKLIEAEEIIDVFPLDCDSSETQQSPSGSTCVVRKPHL